MFEPCAEGAEPRVTVRGSCPFDEWLCQPVPLFCFKVHLPSCLHPERCGARRSIHSGSHHDLR